MLVEVLKIGLLFLVSGILFAGIIYLQHKKQIKKQFEELINYPTTATDIVYSYEDIRDNLSRNRLIYDRKLQKWIKLREIN